MFQNCAMARSLLALALLCATLAAAVEAVASAKEPHYLRASALVTNSKNESQLQCWVFDKPFAVSQDPGTAGAASLDLAQLSNITYTVIPPQFNGGLHNAPHKQLVVFLSGKAVISLPHSKKTGTTIGGPNGLLIATDVTGSGHITKYPSKEQTVTLQIPLAPGKLPKHRVTREDGPCRNSEQIIYS